LGDGGSAAARGVADSACGEDIDASVFDSEGRCLPPVAPHARYGHLDAMLRRGVAAVVAAREGVRGDADEAPRGG
jgi:hypothetical protein